MLHAYELPPGFEPDPPMSRYPDGFVPKQGKILRSDGTWDEAVGGDGPVRWCACRSFGYYQGAGKFGTLIRGGETVSLDLLRPWCDYVTRKVFAKDHAQWILDRLAKAGGFGYQACLLPDTTPRDVWEVVEMFGMVVPEHYKRKREKTALAAANRRARMDALKAKTGGKSRAVLLADEVARLV